MLFKNENTRFFAVFFQASNVAWRCISTWQCQTWCSMPHHTVSHQQHHPNSPLLALASQVPRYKANQTHFGWVGQTCSRQSEHPCKFTWVVPGTPAGGGGHPSASDSQPDPVCAQQMLSTYWFSRTHLLPICVSLSQKILTDWTVFLYKKSVKIINFDLNQLQNKIWWIWFFAELLNIN